VSDVTHFLNAIDAGEPEALNQLLPLVYDELRKLAAAQMAHDKPGQTLDATALVHEAYLRLVRSTPGDSPGANYSCRRHFFAAAAEAMRRILIENARRKGRIKHGGDQSRIELTGHIAATQQSPESLLAIDEALERLSQEDALAAELVKLGYYAGLSVEQAAELLEMSRATAYRHWSYARAWLWCELKPNES
jgi:RNA polymerase sigma factor (TIGR02999 family)